MNNKYIIDWNKAINYNNSTMIVFSRTGGSLHDISLSFSIEKELDRLEPLIEKSNMAEANELLKRIFK